MSRGVQRVLAQNCQLRRYHASASTRLIHGQDDTLNGRPPQRVFSGIQPTGVPHLGNYLGALRQWVDIQTQRRESGLASPTQLLFSIVDLHALTGSQEPELLRQRRHEAFLSLLAIGLRPEESTLFFQSTVSQHSELNWILSTVASMGYLSRMTQWKSKLALSNDAQVTDSEAIDRLRLGLFSYPVLQAADILLYEAQIVPVGEDQLQHIEFTRDLARSFNAAYSKRGNKKKVQTLTIPEAQVCDAKRIMSLRSPTRKMSKSDPDPKSSILITDTEEVIRAKIKSAVTDSEHRITYDVARLPGTANLIDILRHVTRDPRAPEEVAEEFDYLTKREFKEIVADAIVKELAPIRERYHQLSTGAPWQVQEALEKGNATARMLAATTMRNIQEHIGLGEFVFGSSDG
jgi:tryptophanyl-tRNA synthetase